MVEMVNQLNNICNQLNSNECRIDEVYNLLKNYDKTYHKVLYSVVSDYVFEAMNNTNLKEGGKKMDVSSFSSHYHVRCLNKADITDIYSLCSKNNLYYQYCPPFVTEDSILKDMAALPPNKEMSDKYYVGYYKGNELIAVMDFIMAYPDEKTAFIGFFMTAVSIQNAGIGSRIMDELCCYLKESGLSYVRLGWVSGNPQAEHFWHKNHFAETGITYQTDGYTVVVARRVL